MVALIDNIIAIITEKGTAINNNEIIFISLIFSVSIRIKYRIEKKAKIIKYRIIVLPCIAILMPFKSSG
ncbi:MAG: hypothetical protein Q7U60_12460, partial [Candidatus Methanoperedens sp.]|nr:hypothetical protein [Candidatus Methanoperedens sp.]